jgi:hypothetical protein
MSMFERRVSVPRPNFFFKKKSLGHAWVCKVKLVHMFVFFLKKKKIQTTYV